MDCRVNSFFVLVRGEALGLGQLNGTAESLDLLLHLGVLGALADALEVGLDLAIKLEPVTPGAALEGFLDDIAS